MSAARPRVLGLDLSITATGVALPSGDTYTLAPTTTGDARLVEIRDHLAEHLIQVRRPDLAVLEDLPVHARAAGITGMVHGVVRALLADHHIPYALISPATLKAFATGRGNATKADMRMALYKRGGLDIADDNQVDAWWLREAGLVHLSGSLLNLPAAQVRRLNQVPWPTSGGQAA